LQVGDVPAGGGGFGVDGDRAQLGEALDSIVIITAFVL